MVPAMQCRLTVTPEHEINLPKVLENMILKLIVWYVKTRTIRTRRLNSPSLQCRSLDAIVEP